MILDYNSLLAAVGVSAAGLCLTFFSAWLTGRTERFMLTWALGVLLIVGSVFAFSLNVATPGLLLAGASFALLLLGLSVIFGAALQFREGRSPVRRISLAASIALGTVLPWFVIGLDGIGFILGNIAAATLLIGTGWDYMRSRNEAPVPIVGMTLLYTLAGISHVLCATVLIASGQSVLDGMPDNWAEDLNLVISMASVTGIGALSLALNQSRLARRHRQEAMTDGLTGLMNRRALFDRFQTQMLAETTAILVFDLDDFKGVNDRHGHAAGDAVLERFATTIRQSLRASDVAARLGGEEFAAVLDQCPPERAILVAERIRAAFASRPVEFSGDPIACTVSIGVASGNKDGRQFEAVLRDADEALYRAKSNGRNRVATMGIRRAA